MLGRRETAYLRANKGKGGHPQVRKMLLPPSGLILGYFFLLLPPISKAFRAKGRSWIGVGTLKTRVQNRNSRKEVSLAEEKVS